MPFDRITIDPAKLNGQPCVRGTQLTVYRVLRLLLTYPDPDELLAEFPNLVSEDLTQVLSYAIAQLSVRMAHATRRHEEREERHEGDSKARERPPDAR